MSRSGYTDDFGDYDPLAIGRYRQAVRRAIEGKRGQAFLRELIAALDAMPEKRLLSGVFACPNALSPENRGCCAMGAVALARGVTDTDVLDAAVEPEDAAQLLGIAESMAREIAFENDDDYALNRQPARTPEKRWKYMRAWAEKHLRKDKADG